MIMSAMDGARDFIALGGPVVAILLVLSVLSLTTIIFKGVQFFMYRVGRPVTAHAAIDLWKAGQRKEAMERAASGRSATARSVAKAMQLSGSSAAGSAVEEVVALEATARLHELRSGFRLLDSIAQVAPLLGLFGTVLGMIEAFRQLQGAGSSVDPSILAGGIWVALLTTAVGLAVAMPTSLALSWLESRIDDERIAIEQLVSKVMSPLHSKPPTGEGVATAPAPAENLALAT